jgi:CRISPR-associated protein Cas1
MKIAFIDKKNTKINVEKMALKVDEQKIPMRLLDVVIIGTSCSLESKDMVKMTKEGISLLLLSARGDDMAIVYSAKSKNAEVKMEQYQAQSKALVIAKYFIAQKVIRHTQHLEQHGKILDISKVLEKIENTKRIQTLLGVEGSFSKRYFTHYFKLFPKKLHLGKRSKNPPLDPVNSMLSFFYMLVHNLITVRLLSYGFEPSIGFMHQAFRGHDALSSDFMELFRADINAFVFGLFDNQKLKNEDFTKTHGIYLKYEARRRVWGDFQKFNQTLQVKLDKEIAGIRKMIKES